MATATAIRLAEGDWMSCCGSSKFAKEMAKIGPFRDMAEAIEVSRRIWWNQVDVPGWLEAFGAHPRIGALKASAAATEWCAEEQAAALETSNDRALKDLAEWNRLYESKFGFVFLVCATGKTSSEILQTLKSRLTNRPLVELQVAASEQQKITELRLAKLISHKNSADDGHQTPNQRPGDIIPRKFDSETPPESPPTREQSGDAKVDGRLNKIEAHVSGQQPPQATPSPLRPPITTHVLDVSLGKPAAGLEISLERLDHDELANPNSSWIPLGNSVTNQDGRAGALMQPSERVDAGTYRLTFKTGSYISSTSKPDAGPFYPYVCIVFEIKPSQVLEHFHVPLLLSPFSFTTYRGS